MNYKGTLVDGTEFDSSYKRGEPANFPLNHVIPGWTEGARSHEAGRASTSCSCRRSWRTTCARRRRPIPPGALLIFEVELLSAKAAPAPAMAPKPAAPAAGATPPPK